MLALALVITSISFSSAGKINAETDWQTTAITAPAEGKLVGAGYIDVIFNADLENAVSYQLYLDGEKYLDKETGEEIVYEASEGTTSIRGEVYTTIVSAHTVYVVATLEDGTTVQTETRNFYVSKKGLAMGGDMSETVVLNKLNLSWYYNWATPAFNNDIDAGVDHVPMMWGAGEDSIEAIQGITEDSNYILGFNEPDIASQANMTVEEGVAAWPYVYNTGKRTVSPASYNPNGPSEWVTNFLEGIAVEDMGCDSIALHCYGPRMDVGSVLGAVDSAWAKYQKPIWITEISVVGRKDIPSMDHSYEKEGEIEKMIAYVEELVAELDKREYVERYAWFPYNIQSANEIDGLDGCGATAMFDYESGKYTELGFRYSQIGNPEGYVGQTLTEEDRYIYVEPETVAPTTEATTTVAPTTVAPTTVAPTTVAPTKPAETTTTAKKPAKVTLKKAKNVKKKSVTLTWKKATNAKSYQVQYSLSKKFKTAKKFKTKTKTTRKTNFKIKKLTKKKTYYFRVRGVNGKLYGAWSKPKKVKIKK